MPETNSCISWRTTLVIDDTSSGKLDLPGLAWAPYLINPSQVATALPPPWLVVQAPEGGDGGGQSARQELGCLPVVLRFGPQQGDDLLQGARGLETQRVHHVAQVVCGRQGGGSVHSVFLIFSWNDCFIILKLFSYFFYIKLKAQNWLCDQHALWLFIQFKMLLAWGFWILLSTLETERRIPGE